MSILLVTKKKKKFGEIESNLVKRSLIEQKRLFIIREHSRAIWSLLVQSHLLITGSADSIIRVFSCDTYVLLRTIRGHTGGTFPLFFLAECLPAIFELHRYRKSSYEWPVFVEWFCRSSDKDLGYTQRTLLANIRWRHGGDIMHSVAGDVYDWRISQWIDSRLE